MNINKSIVLSLIISMSINSVSFAMHEIHEAVERGDLDRVRELLQAGVDINTQTATWQKTPLHLAAALNGHADVVVFLLQNGAAINAQSDGGFTPLHDAVINGHANVVQVLLEHRAVVDARESRQRSPLHLAREESIARILLDHNADIVAMDENGYTPLHEAARNCRDGVVRLLLDNRADVDTRCNSQKTSLHIAACNGYIGIAQLLLENGAAANAQDVWGETPLHCVAVNGDSAIAVLLLQHGADANALNNSGATPLQAAKTNNHNNIIQLLIDWPLYKAYMRRQALAFAMVTHPRLGEHSRARVLNTASHELISGPATLATLCSHSIEEIHRLAGLERGERGNQRPLWLNNRWVQVGAAVVAGWLRHFGGH